MNQSNTQERVALVTGAAKRIGSVIAQYLHKNGYKVVLHCHTSSDEAYALANSLNKQTQNSASVIIADLTQHNAAAYLIEQTIQLAGRIDLLVNNASCFHRTENLEQAYEHWDALFTINVKAPYILSLMARPYLALHAGVIINITDIHSDKSLTGYSVYCQTKSALTMQTKALAREFAPHVRVNAIAPGAIIWPENENALSLLAKQKIIAKTPLKQHGNPLYIAQMVLSLADNAFITGQIIAVDGGRGLL